LTVSKSQAGSDSNKIFDLDLEVLAGTKGYRQGAGQITVDRAAGQEFAVGWDGNPDAGLKIIVNNRANNLDGATRIGGVRALDIQARNRGTNLSWVKTMELNARNDSGKNVSELHGLHVRAENYGNVYTDVRALDVELSDENTTQAQERMGIIIRSTDLSGMSAVDEAIKVSHTSTNGFAQLFKFATDTGDGVEVKSTALNGLSASHRILAKIGSTQVYIPILTTWA
jgi:hypothetical protein